MRTLTKKAVADVTRRKLRAALTILGIAIGILGLTAIGVASGQLNASFKASTDASSQPDLSFFTAPTSASLDQTLATQPGVKVVEPAGYVPLRWSIPTGHTTIVTLGFEDLSHVTIDRFHLVSGHLPTSANEIALEASANSLKPVRLGTRLTVEVAGKPETLTVSGLVHTPGLPSPAILRSTRGYMREADLESLSGTHGVNAFLVQVHTLSQRDATAHALGRIFAAQGVQVLSVEQGGTNMDATITNGTFGIMNVLSIIALLLSIFLLLSTITTLITEQVPIIGTMKTLGARRGQVIRPYLTSVLIYSVCGTALGIALGILVGSLLVSYLTSLLTLDSVPFQIGVGTLVEALVVGLAIPLAVAAVPVAVGTRISVRDAISGYGLDGAAGGRSRWSAFVGRIGGILPQTALLGARSLFRKRTRALLTLVALTLSATAFLAVQTTTYSLGSFLNGLLDTYHADVFASTAQPASIAQVQGVLARVHGIGTVEPLDQAIVTTNWGNGVLTGVDMAPQLYHRQMVAGRWFTATDHNVVVLSQDAADHSHLKVGDTIHVHDSLHDATWTLIGIARDYNGLGTFGVLLAPITQVNAFEGVPADYTNGALIQSTSARQSDIDALAARVDDALGAAGMQSSVETVQQIRTGIQSEFQTIYVLLYSAAIIVALVGAIGLFNTLAMSVLERRREVGILRSMGATGRNVASVFWTEGLSLTGLAWAVAVVLGIPAAYGFVAILGKLLIAVPFAFNPVSLLAMLVFLVAVASLASLAPVWGASRMRIAQTLRYE